MVLVEGVLVRLVGAGGRTWSCMEVNDCSRGDSFVAGVRQFSSGRESREGTRITARIRRLEEGCDTAA